MIEAFIFQSCLWSCNITAVPNLTYSVCAVILCVCLCLAWGNRGPCFGGQTDQISVGEELQGYEVLVLFWSLGKYMAFLVAHFHSC